MSGPGVQAAVSSYGHVGAPQTTPTGASLPLLPGETAEYEEQQQLTQHKDHSGVQEQHFIHLMISSRYTTMF